MRGLREARVEAQRAAAQAPDRRSAARAAAELLRGDPWLALVVAGEIARGEGRRRLGAWDSPQPMVEALVERALTGFPSDPRCLDPACGAGAFLLALSQAGQRQLRGIELDPAAAEVARVLVPEAQIEVGDGLVPPEAPEAELVLGNPPFIRPEHQDKALRAALQRAHPWLRGRFDLAVPFAAVAHQRARPGGRLGLILPMSLGTEGYALSLRQRWLRQDRLLHLEGPAAFPGAAVKVMSLLLEVGAGGRAWPGGPEAHELLGLPHCPLDPRLRPGDAALSAWIRQRSRTLGELCRVDTGVVSHSRLGGKERLLADLPGEGRLPYVDAADLAAGRRRHLSYRPAEMHRPKDLSLFASPKLLVQRLSGQRPLQVWLDEEGLLAGHTLLVAQPRRPDCPLSALEGLLRSSLLQGLLRLERGPRLDLYPRDLAGLPVPLAWEREPGLDLGQAWELSGAQRARLQELAQG